MDIMEMLDKILLLIEEKGMKQQTILKEFEYDKSFFSDWRAGKIKNPPIDKIVRFAEYFNVSTDFLLGLPERIKNEKESKEMEENKMDIKDINEEQIAKNEFNIACKLGLFNFFRHFNYDPSTEDSKCVFSDFGLLSSKTKISKDKLISFYVDVSVVVNSLSDDTVKVNCPTFDEFVKMMKANPNSQTNKHCLNLLARLGINESKIKYNNLEDINYATSKDLETLRDEMHSLFINAQPFAARKGDASNVEKIQDLYDDTESEGGDD